ncbi:hypothetical protein O181_054249 [Austropuccinia psidii MF-1]|uniref:DUF4939 domain-containing protein n=1 Tax=Austropuccinia psidii MF-1 TaxID=1389203 RepID=A0A9Q3E493_9BASI|nr:hypothetical protein [Austropuccinia psidii MF-1]
MGQLTQSVTPRENSKAPAFKTSSIKAPYSFDGTQAHKLRGFIQPVQLIFHNDPENFFSDRKKVLYSTSFLTGRAGKWIEPYLTNISNEDPSYLLNNWKLFKPNYSLCLVIPMKRLGERSYIHVYRRGLASRVLDHLASHPGTFDTLHKLMDITLELDTRYHERQKERGGNQEKKPPVNGSNFSRPPQDSSSKRPHYKKNKKGKQSQVLKEKPQASLLNKDNKLIGSEKESRIKKGFCIYCGGKHPVQKCFKRPHNSRDHQEDSLAREKPYWES